jgi:hypothetical protein
LKAEHAELPGIAKIKIQNDAKVQRHLVSDHHENMNLLFYDFNNFSKQTRPQTQGVHPPVVQDRLPSRNLKSRGRSRIYAQRKQSKNEASGNRGSLSKNREDLKLD